MKYWLKKLWRVYIPPEILVFLWKIHENILRTEDNLNRGGVNVYGDVTITGTS